MELTHNDRAGADPFGPSPILSTALLIDPRADGPIRAERLGLAGLERLGARLGTACVLAPFRRAVGPLLARFVSNRKAIERVHGRLLAVGDREGLPGLDAEWLLDNFHIIADSLREVRHDLPPGYDALLPKLAAPPLDGFPRAYALALALVAHSDSELDEARIARLVEGFQSVAPFTIGELWALPIMLRLVLLENLRRLSEQMVERWDESRRAERWADEFLKRAAPRRGTGTAVKSENREDENAMAPLPAWGELSGPFVVGLARLLRDQEGAAPALEQLETALDERGADPNEILRREHGAQAANQVTVGNCVLGLRLLSAINWNEFFERNSCVHAALREDPAGAYPRQDFATSDRYRHAVEAIARGSGADEIAIARRAIALACAALEPGRDAGASDADARPHPGPRSGDLNDERRGHVGHYLIGEGRARLQAEFAYRPAWGEWLLEWALGHPKTVYFGAIGVLFAAFLTAAVGLSLGGRAWSWWLLPVVAVLALPISELAVGLWNHLLTLILPPRALPKLDFKDGVPAEHRTIVVVPAMLTGPSSAPALIERLETHYLSNPENHLDFALLTDFADAPSPTMPEDDALLRDALERINALNERYRGGREGAVNGRAAGAGRFFLFHRRRLWNPAQGRWMGWERKRGKLLEFNRLVRGARGTTYAACSAELSRLPHYRYVITLDADTRMPRDTAARMIGALAHPLNRPRFDPAAGRVVAGHGVLQPRVSFHLEAATRSPFAALLATSGGIDPYSTAASDAYMDLFGVGSFTGKGIYDIDAFESATGAAFPENQVLSHDLIEGNFARCGLLSDTELFDDFPTAYHAYARREHRWARGDWQLLPWLGRRAPSGTARPEHDRRPDGERDSEGGIEGARDSHSPHRPDGARRNPLPALERWKILDNLRRSALPLALMVLLALGWTVLPGPAWFWTIIALMVAGLPVLQVALGAIVAGARCRMLAPFKQAGEILPATLGQTGLELAFLPFRAWMMADAIARTLWRLGISREKLLEWETAASTERRLGTELARFLAMMWPAQLVAIALAAAVLALRPRAIVVAAPFLLAWLASPILAHRVSRPTKREDDHLGARERLALRRWTRKTWLFFERFLGDADHWLPPDNFQEVPRGRIAHRTSPTNQGLSLVSTLAAHDLGHIGLAALVDRIERTVTTLESLDRQWGHFFNWYQTETLEPLPPRYISTVDSGNLLACLLVLARGLREKLEAPGFGPAVFDGLGDVAGLMIEEGTARHGDWGPIGPGPPPADLVAWGRSLEDVERWALERAGRGETQSTTVAGTILASASSGAVPATWADRLARQAALWRAELSALAPWLPAVLEIDRTGAAEGWPEEARTRWAALRTELVTPVGLDTAIGRAERLADDLEALAREIPRDGLGAIAEALRDAGPRDLRERVLRLAERAEALAAAMDFRPLYRPDRRLFAIGYNVEQGRLDSACYDLLASESALTSYLVVARGEAPRSHWFQLGRPFVRAAGRLGLISWGGTMFEYLMPRLFLKSLPGTLLDEACRAAVARQMERGRELGLPWGVSESGYSARYLDGDYQYQAFGVPGLGLKQGLERDRVVAPYATMLAAMIAPREALANLDRLRSEGAEGEYGFYEAIDYTPDRLPRGRRSVVVRSYMAHHQGMGLIALANVLLDDLMARRFQDLPMVRAIELLLQERVPVDAPIVEPAARADAAGRPGASGASGAEPQSALGDDGGGATAEPMTAKATTRARTPLSRRLTTAMTPAPRTHVLSNSQYHVMLTNAGSGWSTCRGLDVTRWREDAANEAWGQFFYVRDLDRGAFWSAGFQPARRAPESYEVVFAADKASFRRRDLEIETLLEVIVSPEHRAEVRRVALINHGDEPRTLELTSYAEIALAPRAADRAHPAFSKLFLETEWLEGPGAILCRRRPRSSSEAPLWALHVAALDESTTGSTPLGPLEFETDRARFLGRGRTPARPAALGADGALSNSAGAVLDPIVSLRRRFRIEPGGAAVLIFTTAFAESREEALALADQFRDPSAGARAFELAWAHSQVEHRHQERTVAETILYQRLASHIIHAGSTLRGEPVAANVEIVQIQRGREALRRTGVSGDRPIVLVRMSAIEHLPLARQALGAQTYWRPRGVEFDLVLLLVDLGGPGDENGDELARQIDEIARGAGPDHLERPGGVFPRRSSGLGANELAALQAAARAVLEGERGPLAGQLDRVEPRAPLPPRLAPSRAPEQWPGQRPVELPDGLLFVNGLGGFTHDGREYVILVKSRDGDEGDGLALPPAPWANVIAGPDFGCVVTESGLGTTWALNSQLNRLGPWSNDPVSDPPGEIVYLRDEETGQVWAPTPLPAPSDRPVLVRHGQGYTVFEREAQGLSHELTTFVPVEAPIKVVRMRVRNPGDRPRRISLYFHIDWALGRDRDVSSARVSARFDAQAEAVLAHNRFRDGLEERAAFAASDRPLRSWTADRLSFFGRHGAADAPAALGRVELPGRESAEGGPCATLQTTIELAPGAEAETLFLLGEAESDGAARELIARYREPGRAAAELQRVRDRWDERLGAVRVETPSPALDLLLNRWLIYQVISCRCYARSAFYQSGGAYGFRDQLQDVTALVHAAPELTRAHLLRAASRQFRAGDVQHWWHPPEGWGIRTQISDGPLWLPWAVCEYVRATGDRSVLDERVPYLDAPPLAPDQDDAVGQPRIDEADGPKSLYDHCLRALDRVEEAGAGAHGLPLIGHGDWNDGMDRVGREGAGESTWLAWFAYAVLVRFAELIEDRGDRNGDDDDVGDADGESDRAAVLRRRAERLRGAAEAAGWDGAWYRRAYFDDGTPLGPSSGPDRRIDSIAQSWAVLSGAARPERARRAMNAVDEILVDRDARLVRLLAPPFDEGPLDPGYIRGYLPGVRENGGQYTHAAVWALWAFAQLGQAERAFELLEMLNPIEHARTPEEVARYRVEPYVLAGDVYACPPNIGRGGWTWYTGAAGWAYRAALEAVLGLRRAGDRLEIAPRVPAQWPGFTVDYRFGSTTYHIVVINSAFPMASGAGADLDSGPMGPTPINRPGTTAVWVDGQRQERPIVPLADDGLAREVRVEATFGDRTVPRKLGEAPVSQRARSSPRI